LDRLFVFGQMEGAKEFEVFEFDLLRRVERGASGEGGVNISCAREDDMALYAMVLEPGMAGEVET
jgi:hypothetical protein